MPKSPWEFDEPLFFQALEHYDPVAHHPPPPGYPVFIGVANLVRAVVPTDFRALRLISLAGSIIGLLLLAKAFARITGNALAGLSGALLFYFSPALLVHSTLPISEGGGLALMAGALFWGAAVHAEQRRGDRGAPMVFALFCALAIGWRIQFVVFVLPLLFATLLFLPWRDRFRALLVFTLVCLLWFVPLAMAVGGFEPLIRFETGQAGYLAEHDADVSRSGWTFTQIVLRFVAHPWGVKLASFPLLLVAAIGAVLLVRRREAIPIGVAAAVYIAFALAVMDPADGVRYAIPFVLATACAAGMGVVWLAQRARVPATALAALFAAGSLVYVSSLLSQRGATSSPPVRAAEFALRTYRPHAVALYELPLWPHATYYLREFEPSRLDDGLARFYDRPDVPLFVYADGAGTTSFRWEPSDAYSKLTRNHYRVASIIPIPPEARYRTIRGIYGPEREPEGLAWRWLAPDAALQLPRGGARHVELRVGLPATSPIETNAVAVSVDGVDAGTFHADRGRVAVIELDVPAGAPVITLRAEKSFVPAAIAGSLNRDPRTLAVKMYGLTARRAAAVPAVRQSASR